MTGYIHMMNKQFKNICGVKNKNADASHWWAHVTCRRIRIDTLLATLEDK